MTFNAVLVEKVDGKIESRIETLDESQLPPGEVEVDIDYSTINYKDGMVLHGMGNLVRSYPHIPGVDFAGVVKSSRVPAFKPGDGVVLTGWRVGEMYWGGLSERANVKAEWLLPLPEAFSARDAMAVGTAGLTAMLAVIELEAYGLSPTRGPVLVTGATGGVGTFATQILAALGYEVHAVSGKPEMAGYLTRLGAKSIIARAELNEPSNRPLEGTRWAACIDAVGGVMLARVLAQMEYGGSVAAVGMAGGAQLQTTVIPFLLRGVKLLGIDSVMCPAPQRQAAWDRLALLGIVAQIQDGVREIGLDEVVGVGRDVIDGKISGRVVVNVRKTA